MNRRMILYMPLQILKAVAVLMLLPALVSLFYQEKSVWAFLICAAATFAVAQILQWIIHPENKVIYAREGFVIVALAWVLMAVFGALPFVVSGEIPNFVDALFETMSGFTTTGSSILRDVTALSHGIAFWRSFTHWLGGMGILVFVMAITNMSDRPIHIMRAEMPGPIVGKLVPKAKNTAKILYLIYIGLTLAEWLTLKLGGMSAFEAAIHAFGSAGTGGFGVRPDSLTSYSPFLQWAVAVFMFLFGVNFNLYYLILAKKIGTALRSTELWTYVCIGVVSTAAITLNIRHLCGSFSEALRLSAFQVSSIATTTGFATADFNLWPDFSKTVLLILMLVGACAGSTAGGLKVSRVMILFKSIHREIMKTLHPRGVRVLRLEGKTLDEAVVSNTFGYFGLYALVLVVCFLLVSVDKFDLETSLTASVACFNNIGPAFGAAGPMSNYADFSVLSKLTLTLAMLLGRLEIFPVLLAVAPVTWTKK